MTEMRMKWRRRKKYKGEEEEEEINRCFGPFAAHLFNLIRNNEIGDVQTIQTNSNNNINLYSCASRLIVELKYSRSSHSRLRCVIQNA